MLKGKKIGLLITSSLCNFQKTCDSIAILKKQGADLYPVFSYHMTTLDSRFGTTTEHQKAIEAITEKKIMTTISESESFGPKLHMDAMLILPCTGNTLSKLANAITDTPALMAAKAHLRNQKPLIIALSTNDGLGLCMKNLGLLMNAKNVYFVPYGQDDPVKKPNSLSCCFPLIPDTILSALEGKQLQPVLQNPLQK